jgi:GTPase
VNGRTKGMHGAMQNIPIFEFHLGTIVYTEDKSQKIGESQTYEELLLHKGGKGGRGNMAFATHRNPAPDFAENGDPGVYT